ncbi:hypothetical protein UUU_26050 (plasmid) [Klebsiella pneumoniae subsp. pneumoniae DSM 30104 = JCM 1662 = NBRC 14940]|nr:hypothetical protein UUU_26050 [Klebsiella pneumoniae subsp. pneumoniae DSM 30104 = JCM 1662 = NBRC 14940]
MINRDVSQVSIGRLYWSSTPWNAAFDTTHTATINTQATAIRNFFPSGVLRIFNITISSYFLNKQPGPFEPGPVRMSH